jgi:hypothetical protein
MGKRFNGHGHARQESVAGAHGAWHLTVCDGDKLESGDRCGELR